LISPAFVSVDEKGRIQNLTTDQAEGEIETIDGFALPGFRIRTHTHSSMQWPALQKIIWQVLTMTLDLA